MKSFFGSVSSCFCAAGGFVNPWQWTLRKVISIPFLFLIVFIAHSFTRVHHISHHSFFPSSANNPGCPEKKRFSASLDRHTRPNKNDEKTRIASFPTAFLFSVVSLPFLFGERGRCVVENHPRRVIFLRLGNKSMCSRFRYMIRL